MAKPKLNAAKVEAELRLLAAGACGGDPGCATLADIGFENLQRIAWAVSERWFAWKSDSEVFRMTFCTKWQTYATLAAAIVKERSRLDAVKAREVGNAS
jgi:hypothetical protein